MARYKILLLVAFAIMPGRALVAENWPSWRGADGRGISNEENLPVRWNATDHVRWKVRLPESGNSTPIIWEDRVFLTQAMDGGVRRALICFDRTSGEKQWQREVLCSTMETTHRQNPPCSGSPTTDGKAVYAHFASAGVVAYDFQGQLLWQRNLGSLLHRWGNGSSPVLYGDQLIVYHGPGEPTRIVSLDKNTGETIWTSEEIGINSPIFGSWSTPLILRVGDHDELIQPLPGSGIGETGWMRGYDPTNGKILWQCEGLGNEVYAMPVAGPSGKIVVGISGHNGPTMAVRVGGKGEVTSTHRLWRTETKNPQRIGTGIIHEGLLYISNANGLFECLDVETGTVVWRQRLGGNLWGSIVMGDGNLYVGNLEGDTFVLRSGSKFELLSRNSVQEESYAALAISQGDVFLRTYEHLYCISGPERP